MSSVTAREQVTKEQYEFEAETMISLVLKEIEEEDLEKIDPKIAKLLRECQRFLLQVRKNKSYRAIQAKKKREMLERVDDYFEGKKSTLLFEFSNWKIDGLSDEVKFFLDFMNKNKIGMTQDGVFTEYHTGYRLKDNHVKSMLRRAYKEEINKVSSCHLKVMIERFIEAILKAMNDPKVIGNLTEKKMKLYEIKSEYLTT